MRLLTAPVLGLVEELQRRKHRVNQLGSTHRALPSLGVVSPEPYAHHLVRDIAGICRYVTYLKARQLDANAFRATFACIFLLDGAARVTGYFSTAVIDLQLLTLIAMSVPMMILGMYIGGKIHTSISPQVFTKGISILLLVSGLSLMLR